MPENEFSTTHKSTKTESQNVSPDVVNKYWGIVVFCILAYLTCGLYLFCIIGAASSGLSRNWRIFLATLMYVSVILASWAYWLTHRTPPPKIPSRFSFTPDEMRILREKKLDFAASQDELLEMAEKRGVRTRTPEGKVNACKHCCLIKPERTHHCSVCKICVPKMDHHCPWFGNCIHYKNFKYFLQAIFYCIFGVAFMGLSAIVLVIMTDDALDKIKATNGGMAGFVVLVLISFGVCMPTSAFFYSQLRHAMKNVTTLEGLKGMVYFADGAEETFNLGSYHLNLIQQLGPVYLAWFVPIPSTPGDGTQFLLKSELEGLKKTPAKNQSIFS